MDSADLVEIRGSDELVRRVAAVGVGVVFGLVARVCIVEGALVVVSGPGLAVVDFAAAVEDVTLFVAGWAGFVVDSVVATLVRDEVLAAAVVVLGAETFAGRSRRLEMMEAKMSDRCVVIGIWPRPKSLILFP
jgi:hypothetical protein